MKDSDLKITTTCGSGPGGQHRNRVQSCVTVEHLPTGLKEKMWRYSESASQFEHCKGKIIKTISRILQKSKEPKYLLKDVMKFLIMQNV